MMDPLSKDNYLSLLRNEYFNLDLINQESNIIVLKSVDALITPVQLFCWKLLF